MKIGVIGLGRMGSAIAQRLIDAGYDVVGFDTNPAAVLAARQLAVDVVEDITIVANKARIIFLSLPAGKIIDDVIKQALSVLKKGDVIVDAGNSNFADSQRRAQLLAVHDMFFLDCGLSGGLQGRGLGFCLMVGGDEGAYRKLEEVWAAVAAPGGVAYVGPSGAGHYVKMVHNAIEYALLEAYAEGFQLLHEGEFAQQIDLEQIARVWNQGSIIRSWILELLQRIFERDQEFKHISGEVAQGATVEWALQEAMKEEIPTPIIEDAYAVREQSRKTGGTYATKLIALLRHEFGGHLVKKSENKQ